ncbi:hypothetical protein IMX26_01175 [Clostridium sp. 'deep sea']|uniref:4Fe-4S binding protein n=1 Tax=Clostridium sp. 'deep sea' TaxID=2779445 RepID=UPI0018968674|nr:4Fe-4S binding protein [Clostridium sp. 'deep sea']QOR35488.1 hypothetical protein IMX26_01175 [Clostridium sp. 'deep sea']
MLKKILKTKFRELLFFGTILFFLLSIINISFSFLGMICMILPFVLYYRYKEKLWCKYYCPRSKLFTKLLSKISLGKKLPKSLTSKRAKYIVLSYFGINMFFMFMSTYAVLTSKIEPANFVKMFVFFKAPFTLPQLTNWALHSALLHLSYRVFSMFFSSILLGLVLGFIYRPRTWCVVCPISTLTTKSKKIVRVNNVT